MTSYLNGLSAGMGGGNPAPSKRGEVNGWSAAAVRRHTRWLYSVDAESITGVGLAVTLTVRDIPPSSVDFHAARRRFEQRMQRLGLLSSHWVIEWTRRRRPHLHMALYWPAGMDALELGRIRAAIVDAWVAVAGDWGAAAPGQHVSEISGPLGWLQYLSKHAARGAQHYQRQGKPEGWEKTGRLWGHTGDWPVVEPMQLDMSRQTYWRLRRLLRSWRVADARQALRDARGVTEQKAARRRLVAARGMLACNSRKLSEVRGVSEWADEGVTAQLLALLHDDGHVLVQR